MRRTVGSCCLPRCMRRCTGVVRADLIADRSHGRIGVTAGSLPRRVADCECDDVGRAFRHDVTLLRTGTVRVRDVLCAQPACECRFRDGIYFESEQRENTTPFLRIKRLIIKIKRSPQSMPQRRSDEDGRTKLNLKTSAVIGRGDRSTHPTATHTSWLGVRSGASTSLCVMAAARGGRRRGRLDTIHDTIMDTICYLLSLICTVYAERELKSTRWPRPSEEESEAARIGKEYFCLRCPPPKSGAADCQTFSKKRVA